MKTERLRNLLVEYLADEPRNTQEILDYINGRLKHGTTSNILGNILGKDTRFKKIGTETKSIAEKGGYRTYTNSI